MNNANKSAKEFVKDIMDKYEPELSQNIISKEFICSVGWDPRGEGVLSTLLSSGFDIFKDIDELPQGIFMDDKTLTKLSIPGKFRAIPGNFCPFCENLSELKIQDGVTYIGGCAFEGCISLEKLYLPNTVEIIDTFAFADCNNLKDVYYDGSEDDWEETEKQGNPSLLNASIHFNNKIRN